MQAPLTFILSSLSFITITSSLVYVAVHTLESTVKSQEWMSHMCTFLRELLVVKSSGDLVKCLGTLCYVLNLKHACVRQFFVNSVMKNTNFCIAIYSYHYEM